MGTAIVYLLVMAVVVAVLFIGVSAVFGRGETLPPLAPDSTPTALPAHDVLAEDLDAVRFSTVIRGYKPSEVDWVLERLGREITDLRAQVAARENASSKSM